jgi:glycosyltransferase involved in cell wall biosynthesis
MLNSFSVIVPALNKENEVIRTLESVEASIAYFFAHHDPSHAVQAEVVVVNDGSDDRTLERLLQFSQDKAHVKVISHSRRMSAGTARNTGAKIASGDIFFFCDGDDLFFREHIYLCFQFLNHDPQTSSQKSFVLPTEQGELTLNLPDQPVGVMRTGAYMKDYVHPYWKVAIENSIPQNLCVRRDCHDFIEGFPEERLPFNRITCEDISYQTWLARFFRILKVNIDTVEYIRYPGNTFDRQLKKFQTPPEQYQDDTPPDILEFHRLRQIIEQQRLGYLFEKFKYIPKTPEFLAVLNWQQLGTDYLAQNQFQEAIVLLECWLQWEPENPNARNLLAATYNNAGSALRKQGNLAEATHAFKQAVDLNPALANPDRAKIHFNLAKGLGEQGEREQALHLLQQALELDPSFSEAIVELSRLQQMQLL